MDRRIVIIDNPLIKHYLTILRNYKTEPPIFRDYMERIGFYLGFEVAKHLDWEEIDVKTPLGIANGLRPSRELIAVGVLGASLPLLYGFIKSMPWAGIGLIAARRIEKENDYPDVEMYYTRLPRDLRKKEVVLLDPMLATGFTLNKSVDLLKSRGASKIIVVSVIASREGVKRILGNAAVSRVIVCAVDEELDEKYFIVPGLGDAGDRALDPYFSD